MYAHRYLPLFVMFLIVCCFQACSGGFLTNPELVSASNNNTGTTTANTETGLQAFQSGLYNFANTQGCVSCHAAAVAPFFASPDINTAYTQAATLVNFADPTSSLFVSKSGNNHCGVASCQGTSNPATVSSLLVQWANAVNSAGSGAVAATPMPTYMTATVAMPTTIPAFSATATPAVVNFQLSNMTPALSGLAQAILQVEVQMVNATTYMFTNPRIGGTTVPVTIGGIHIFIRPSGTATGVGTEGSDPANLWDGLTGLTAAAFAITTMNPTAPIAAVTLTKQPVYVQELSAADSITIGIDSISGAGTTTTQSAGLTAFQNGLYAFANTQGCVSCHASTNTPYFASPTLSTAYAQAKTIVNFANPSASLFITFASNNHCGVAACQTASNSTTVSGLLTTWANAENH